MTIMIPDDLAEAIDKYTAERGPTAIRSSVIEGALREYLAQWGSPRPQRVFRITPARKGSGRSDVSVEHDRYLAE